MALVNGCEIPEDLHFDVEREVWVRREPGGTVLLGMTDPAQTRAGRLVSVTPKRPGRVLRAGDTAAVVESAKWLGPFPTPLSGELVGANPAVQADPALVNRDPYGEGWLVRLRPLRLEEELPLLAAGPAAAARYRERLEREGLYCLRCAPAGPEASGPGGTGAAGGR